MADYHKGCGGEVINKKCSKCGKTWKIIGWVIGKEIEYKEKPRVDYAAYKRRIRSGKDITSK